MTDDTLVDLFRSVVVQGPRSAAYVMMGELSVLRAAPPAAGLSASDQDSGVEDEDLSPRPSPSPHLPAAQVSHRSRLWKNAPWES